MHSRPARLLLAVLAALLLFWQALPAAHARGLPLVRDAEIEDLLRLYANPVFRAAGLNPGAVKVHLLQDSRINAFVAGGQRIFVNTGLLQQAKTPGEVIGVLAHETGHIAGAHLVRMGLELNRLSTLAIIQQLLAAGAVVGGVASGRPGAIQAGKAIALGGQSMLQRHFLSYARAQESAADQAAATYLERMHVSGRGMLSMFQRLANRSIASLAHADPYVLTHPMPMQRIRNLERRLRKSRWFDKPDPPYLVWRHKMMHAKLTGYLGSPRTVWRKYPKSDNSMPARYARAIAAYRVGDSNTALRLLASLIREKPKYPYFHELKGEVLLKSGRIAPAIDAYSRAAALAPRNGLIRVELAQALLARGDARSARAALKQLRAARRGEGGRPLLHRLMAQAHATLGNIQLAELETAESALRAGDFDLAIRKARRLTRKLKKGTPGWLRANDILATAQRLRKRRR